MPVKNRIAEYGTDLTQWRRDIHTHPELRFEETRTAKLVADKLRAFGCDEVVEGIAQTGVVGVIRGCSSLSGRVLGFRADMDALPILEQTGAEHASIAEGKMHACGHDGHTTMLLGAARYLAETRNFDGTVVLLFQPAEEGAGGAKAMVDAGVMDRFGIDEVYGMHNMPGIAEGQFALCEGPLMAAVAFFDITVKGRGGHGAIPHATRDATVAASAIVGALQSIISRNVDPQQAVVVTVGGIRSDSDTHNVIADSVTLKGTTRYLDPALGDWVENRIREVASSTAQAYDCTAELHYRACVAPTINAKGPTAIAAGAARAVAGDVDLTITPTMAGEDFADMLAARPGAFIFIGNGDSAGLHHPAYDFNDTILPIGSSWFATLAESRLGVA